jgi:hypothetical protein
MSILQPIQSVKLLYAHSKKKKNPCEITAKGDRGHWSVCTQYFGYSVQLVLPMFNPF